MIRAARTQRRVRHVARHDARRAGDQVEAVHALARAAGQRRIARAEVRNYGCGRQARQPRGRHVHRLRRPRGGLAPEALRCARGAVTHDVRVVMPCMARGCSLRKPLWRWYKSVPGRKAAVGGALHMSVEQ